MAQIDFLFDFFSPFSYLASVRIGQIAARHGATIIYHPVDNRFIKQAAGTTGAPNHTLGPKYRYLRADLARWAKRYGVVLTSPDRVAVENHEIVARINRGFIIAERQGKGENYLHVAYDRIWGANPDVSEQALRDLAPAAGTKAEEFLRAIDSDEIRAAADREHHEAHRRGVFGVPTFIVDGQLFWGNDRLEMLDEYLTNSAKKRPTAEANP